MGRAAGRVGLSDFAVTRSAAGPGTPLPFAFRASPAPHLSTICGFVVSPYFASHHSGVARFKEECPCATLPT